MLDCPPKDNEIEVTVCGPGVGESIIVHLGDQNWIIVDSTLVSGEPWPLWYLRSIGVDPSNSVRLVVATHWHSDHVGGIHRVLEASQSAQFIFSKALLSDEFRRLLARNPDNDLDKVSAPLAEIRRCFYLLTKRSKSWTSGRSPFKPIAANSIIWSGTGANGANVWALSPSAHDELASLAEFAGQFIELNEFCSGLSFKNPNYGSIVLRLDAGDESILLGADLINFQNNYRGWQAVLCDSTIPKRKSAVFKVPHHGSENALNTRVWSDLLCEIRHAVITPYLPSALPGSEDIERISREGCQLSITHRRSPAAITRRSEVEKIIDQTTKKRHNKTRIGEISDMVRYRKIISSDQGWMTEHFGTSHRVR